MKIPGSAHGTCGGLEQAGSPQRSLGKGKLAGQRRHGRKWLGMKE